MQEDLYEGTQGCSSQSGKPSPHLNESSLHVMTTQGTERLSDARFEESDIESSEPEADFPEHMMDSETDSDKSEISLGTEQSKSEDGIAVIDNSVEMEIQDANNHDSSRRYTVCRSTLQFTKMDLHHFDSNLFQVQVY